MTSPTLRPLPASFASTRAAVHAVAENALCVARHAAIGRIGLQASARGVETAPFGDTDRVVAIEGNDVVDRNRSGERRAPITTVRAAASFLGVTPGVPAGLWHPVSTTGFDDELVVDATAFDALANWYAFVTAALHGLGAAGASVDPLTLWPEGFDLATTGGGVNYGGSPGDRFIDQPYLYVGPINHPYPPADPPFWNAPFGASLRYDDIESLDHAMAFLVRGFSLTSTGR
jgi:hypothetical protein